MEGGADDLMTGVCGYVCESKKGLADHKCNMTTGMMWFILVSFSIGLKQILRIFEFESIKF